MDIGYISERMSEDARKVFEAWCEGKAAPEIETAVEALDASGLQNRNGKIFLETVQSVCVSPIEEDPSEGGSTD